MRWNQLRKHYPSQWLLIEAIKAHSESNRRILEDISVIGAFSDSVSAMQDYARLHRQAPGRELYVFHTSREELEIAERCWLGVRSQL